MLSAAPSRRAAAILTLLAGLFACTFERETAVLRHDLSALESAGFGVSSFNIEEKLKRGFIPEVIAYLTGPSGRGVETEKGIRLLAEAKLEAGDFPVAEALATRALSRSLRSELRADLEWLRSQATSDGNVVFADMSSLGEGNPPRLRQAYDSGDHLHPNDDGRDLMARIIAQAAFARAATAGETRSALQQFADRTWANLTSELFEKAETRE